MIDASLAQLVEHDTLNVGVQGSSPWGGTKQKTDNQWLSVFLFLYVYPFVGHFRAGKRAFSGKCLPFCLPRFSEGKQKVISSAQQA